MSYSFTVEGYGDLDYIVWFEVQNDSSSLEKICRVVKELAGEIKWTKETGGDMCLLVVFPNGINGGNLENYQDIVQFAYEIFY